VSRESVPIEQEVSRFGWFSDGMREGYDEYWVKASDYDAVLAEKSYLLEAGKNLVRHVRENGSLRGAEGIMDAFACE
jgi:hypothetical protein